MKREYFGAVRLKEGFRVCAAEYFGDKTIPTEGTVFNVGPNEIEKYDRCIISDAGPVLDTHPNIKGFDRAHIVSWPPFGEGAKTWLVSRPAREQA